MMRRLLPAVFLVSLSCGRELTPEVEAVVQAVNDASAATLVAAEVASNAVRQGDGCPAVTSEGVAGDLVVSADYGEGCVPDSGLVPVELSGVVTLSTLAEDFSVDLVDFAVGGQAVEGTIAGSARGSEGDLTLGLDSELVFALAGFPGSMEWNLLVDLGASIEIDGSAFTDLGSDQETSLTLTDVVLEYADITTCPEPGDGTIVAEYDRDITTLEYTGEEMVELNTAGKWYKASLCDYPSALYPP